MKTKIRLHKTDAVGNQNKAENVGISLESTHRLLPYTSIVDSVDAYEVYLNERNQCTNYRLILTINPFCSNVLFNSCTEIIRNEGSHFSSGNSQITVVTDNSSLDLSSEPVIGKKQNVNRNDMIRNTEYSKSEIGFSYHPGYDIFNNHILRNKGFKLVQPIGQGTTNTDKFNTIEDVMRYADGEIVEFWSRQDDADASPIQKHLYNYDDIMEFGNEEAVNSNLVEVDGWFGFYNPSNIEAKRSIVSRSGSIYSYGEESIDIGKAINDKGRCEFVDMYPDRTLFSFNPKKNNFTHKLEYNWDIQLTYPFENYYEHKLVKNVNASNSEYQINALYVLDVKKTIAPNGVPVLLFRTPCKHNLSRGDEFVLYVSLDDGVSGYREVEKRFTVSGLGDEYRDNEEYYFYVSDTSIIDEVFRGGIETTFYMPFYGTVPSGTSLYAEFPTVVPDGTFEYIQVMNQNGGVDSYRVINQDSSGNTITVDDIINRNLNLSSSLRSRYLRICRISGGVNSEYYIRKFRKVPNRKFESELLTDDIASDPTLMDAYISANCMNGTNMLDFDRVLYQLAFNRTIYNDKTTQVTFTDDINIEYLRDNRGRPLTDVYCTIIKRNEGHDKWYTNSSSKDFSDSSIEYSHCFGKVTCGFDYLVVDGDAKVSVRNAKGDLSDVRQINNSSLYSTNTICDNTDDISYRGTSGTELDVYYGDVVEYDRYNCEENVLSDVHFRFNTAQRECSTGNTDYRGVSYDEIMSDDYDKGGFSVDTIVDTNSVYRDEGYHYKSHYKIPLRSFGDVIQDSHYTLVVEKAKPIQTNGIYIDIKFELAHSASIGDIVYICDDSTGMMFESHVVAVVDEYELIIDKMPNSYINYVNWLNMCSGINDGTLIVRRKNENIPDYAEEVYRNVYMWRDVLINGDGNSSIEEYPYANNALYIDTSINFYLQRQDPKKIMGLNVGKLHFPSDIVGKSDETSGNFEYKLITSDEC